MTIRPRTSEMMMGHTVEFTFFMFMISSLYAYVWEHCYLNPSGSFVMRYGLVGPFKLGQERIL